MAKKNDEIPRLVVRKNATLREIYARLREMFTAADLQKYTEIEEGIPMERIIAEMQAIHRKEGQKSRTKWKRYIVRKARKSEGKRRRTG